MCRFMNKVFFIFLLVCTKWLSVESIFAHAVHLSSISSVNLGIRFLRLHGINISGQFGTELSSI